MAIHNTNTLTIDINDLYDHGSVNSLEMITELGTADPPIEIIAEEGSWPPGDPYPTMITEGYNDALHYTNRT
jgi:hypothetical protein